MLKTFSFCGRYDGGSFMVGIRIRIRNQIRTFTAFRPGKFEMENSHGTPNAPKQEMFCEDRKGSGVCEPGGGCIDLHREHFLKRQLQTSLPHRSRNYHIPAPHCQHTVTPASDMLPLSAGPFHLASLLMEDHDFVPAHPASTHSRLHAA